MNRLTTRKIITALTTISLTVLVSSVKPILAHSGHDHSKPEPKSTKIEQENIESSPTPEIQPSEESENQTLNVTLQQTNQFNFLPQSSEIIFLLLVGSPIILKVVKQKIHQ
ncbi:MAG: hypothetical protein QNJ37_19395 [Crocosphaera sp.]|nr:hypothetical protein [Crocosphaera sp.]